MAFRSTHTVIFRVYRRCRCSKPKCETGAGSERVIPPPPTPPLSIEDDDDDDTSQYVSDIYIIYTIYIYVYIYNVHVTYANARTANWFRRNALFIDENKGKIFVHCILYFLWKLFGCNVRWRWMIITPKKKRISKTSDLRVYLCLWYTKSFIFCFNLANKYKIYIPHFGRR